MLNFAIWIIFFLFDMVMTYYLTHLILPSIQKERSDRYTWNLNQWPNFKIFCYELPSSLYSNLFTSPLFKIKEFSKYDDKNFHFFIEYEFHRQLLKSPVLTHNPDEADLFYIPYYPTFIHFISLNPENESKNLLSFLKKFPYFWRRNCSDHIFFRAFPFTLSEIFHNNSFGELENSILLSFDFDFSSAVTSWSERKNIVVPYISYHPFYKSYSQEKKNISIFLSMAIEIIEHSGNQMLRKNIFDFFNGVDGVYIVLMDRKNNSMISEILDQIPKLMLRSKYCIVPRGDSASSKRFYDAIRYGCIPIVISNAFRFPYEKVIIDYTEFVIQVPENEVFRIPQILSLISEEQYQIMLQKTKEAYQKLHFSIGQKPRIGDGFWSLTWMLFSKFLFLSPTSRFDLLKNKL